ncbi:MAG: type I methionyl aminopeptidase [Flaviflexus sp.]|uniref:type I methionyl aminopeptidase n=1 Tax=Flaviflexus sp. TaxID=1969482 RepID=UPI003F911694
MFGRESIEYKSNEQILKIREAALVVADIHDALREAAKPGVTTGELDLVAARVLQDAGARSNFLGYYDYPANACISVNEVIVHGIPGDRVLTDTDIVSFDCGAIVDGWHGDACFTLCMPNASEADRKLSENTETAMWAGIAALATAKHVGEVGGAIEDYVDSIPEDNRPGLVEEYMGHGIGSAMHQPPDVLNYRAKNKGAKLKPGMVLCVEPMLTIGSPESKVLEDDWTVITTDGSNASHWEHEVAIHKGGIWVLTARDGGAEGLRPFGVTPVPLG